MAIKRLNRSVNAYVRGRDKMSLVEWRKLRQIMRAAENEILQKLKAINITEWGTFNLKRILQSMDTTIRRFDIMFKEALPVSQKTMVNYAALAADKNAVLGGLKAPDSLFLSDEVMQALKPLSDGFVQYFTSDMAKIINSEITMGIINNQSVSVVARSIKDKFGIDTQMRDKLKKQKNILETQFKQGKISEEKYKKTVKAINQKLQSGSMMSYARAERIAQTEMLRGTSYAEYSRALDIAEINPDAVKMWLNAHKPDARPSHLDAEARYKSNPIKVNEVYHVGGEEGLFPCAPSFSAKNSAYCHCTSVTINKALTPEVDGLKVKG